MSRSHFEHEGAATPAREPIAIVGIGCRLPGAASPDGLWRLLLDGGDAIGEIPATRFDTSTLYDPTPATAGKVMTRWGGFVDHIEDFDAEFFGISPREAERLDPQQRLLLECAWDALEDAGHVPARLNGTHAGVFIGLWINEYESRLFRNPNAIDFYMTTGTGRYAASGRLSYVFGLQGPSLTLDTGCSSSLVAVHLACQSLWNGETDFALAGGANAILEPFVTIAYSQSQMMAPDGRCKFGDARADGYVRSDGAGIVVLKPLSKAVADGDPIYATILGSAVTNDGRGSGFMTTPARDGQEAMLRQAYRSAGVSPGEAQYVEAHGTGTRAGDPVELGALGAVLAIDRPSGRPCRVGSIKTNIGHTEGAAGIAGLIKTALSVKHRVIPRSLHLERPNPEIPWDSLPLVIPTHQEPWPEGDRTIAGVSSFGISGTNAHVVLGAAPVVPAQPVTPRALLLALSGHSPVALTEMAQAWRAHVSTLSDDVLTAACHAAGARRTHHASRAAVTAPTRAALLDQLDALIAAEPREGVTIGRARDGVKVAFVFPGQGSQWIGMGRRLYDTEPAFGAAMDDCDRAIAEETGWSVIAELRAEAERSRLAQIDVVQPALFAVEVSLAALWRSWGVEPAAVVGHSMGEVAAACVAGALSVRDAVRVICRRSRLLKQTSGRGAMAVVELTFAQAEFALQGSEHLLSVAVSNSTGSTVISGDPAALDQLISRLEQDDVFCRRVKVDVASHSPQMDPLRQELADALSELQPRAAGVPIYSTVRSVRSDGAGFDATYWVDNLRRPVMFAQSVQQLLADGVTLFIEMSPHPILTAAVREGIEDAGSQAVALGCTRREEDEQLSILGSLGAAYVAGADITWTAVYPDSPRMAPLPQYAFQRERFWIDAAPALTHAPAPAIGDPGALAGTLFEPRWEAAPLATPPKATDPGRWVIFADDSGMAAALAGELQTAGARTVMVERGLERRVTPTGGCVIRPSVDEDYDWALRTIGADGALRGLVHLWPVDASGHNATVSDLGWHLLQVARAATSAGPGRTPSLCIVTRGAQKVVEQDTVEGLTQSALWGLARAIAEEHPDADGGIVDLDPQASIDTSAALLARELLSRPSIDQVAYRGESRLALRLLPMDGSLLEGTAFRPHAGGAYLISGGMGALGLHVARFLAARGARRVILASRTALPPRHTWTTVADPRVEAVRALEADGVHVHIAAVDVADEPALAAWVQQYRSEGWPAIRGVVHCAGVLAPQLVSDMTRESFDRVLRPKVQGAVALDRVLAGEPLDCFILFSSAAALFPIPGQAHYSAANAFLDAFAHHRRAKQRPALTLNWAVWADGGMAASFGDDEQFSARGVDRITAPLADTALDALTGSGVTQAVVAPFRMDAWRLNAFPPMTDALLARLIDQQPMASPAAAAGPLWIALISAMTDDTERRTTLETLLRDEVARVIKRPAARIDLSKPFRTMGLDSLMGVELRNRLQQVTGLKLSATTVWNYPTVTMLADHRVAGAAQRID